MKWFVRYYFGNIPTKIKKNITVEADTKEQASIQASKMLPDYHQFNMIKFFDAVRIEDKELRKNEV